MLLIVGALSFLGYKYFFSDRTQALPPRLAPPRLAPSGTFYIKDKISVTTEHGITSFPAGKKVTLVRESGNNLIVTDGRQEVEVAKTSLTNDLDVLEGIISSNANQKKQIAANAAAREEAAKEDIKKWEEGIQNEQRRLQLEITELNIAAERLNRELEVAKTASQASLTKAPTKAQFELEETIALIQKKNITKQR
jgi:hypothetical protein